MADSCFEILQQGVSFRIGESSGKQFFSVNLKLIPNLNPSSSIKFISQANRGGAKWGEKKTKFQCFGCRSYSWKWFIEYACAKNFTLSQQHPRGVIVNFKLKWRREFGVQMIGSILPFNYSSIEISVAIASSAKDSIGFCKNSHFIFHELKFLIFFRPQTSNIFSPKLAVSFLIF